MCSSWSQYWKDIFIYFCWTSYTIFKSVITLLLALIFCLWLLLATAVSMSLPSAHLLLLWITFNIITGRHQTAKVPQVGKSHLPQKKLVLITADVKTGGSWSVWSWVTSYSHKIEQLQPSQWWQSRAILKRENPLAVHSSLPQSTGAILSKTHNRS